MSKKIYKETYKPVYKEVYSNPFEEKETTTVTKTDITLADTAFSIDATGVVTPLSGTGWTADYTPKGAATGATVTITVTATPATHTVNGAATATFTKTVPAARKRSAAKK